MSKKDYYSILGISKDSSENEIKKAYRTKSLIHHPDKGGNEEDFKLLTEAYSVLSDKTLRDQYDNPNNPNDNIFNFNFNGNANNIFEQFFQMNNQFSNMNVNVQHNKKCKDHNYNLNIKLKDVYFGLQKTLKLTINKKCLKCFKTCSNCNGSGIIIQRIQTGPFLQQIQTHCNICNGIGSSKLQNDNCLHCQGKTEITEEKTIIINIDKGIQNNTIIKYPNLGEQISKEDQEPGDLNIIIIIDKDPYFERNNNDLILKSKLTICECNCTTF